jgi:hypothetical protein
MSNKSNRISKRSKPKPQFKPVSHFPLPRRDELRPDEIVVIRDPYHPAKVHSYMLGDGTHIALDNSTVPANVPFVEPSLLVTSMQNKGERNTLAYHFGHIMSAAEELYGPRNTAFLFLGIEFIPLHGRVRYVAENSLVIQLSFHAMQNPIKAYFELAHECIHLLWPDPTRSTLIIEEGMATTFATMYMRDKMNIDIKPLAEAQRYYDEAQALVTSLLEIDEYGIKKLREEEPNIKKITKSLILKYFPTFPETSAARLTRTFLNGVTDHPITIARYNSESLEE